MNKNKITIYNILSTIILQGLAFLSGPIFSSLLGTENYGIASVYLTWVTIASTVFSLQAAGTVALARTSFPIKEQLQFQSSVLCLATFAYAFFSILTIFISLFLSNRFQLSIPMIVLGLAHGWGMYVIGFVNSKFTYEFKADRNFILSILVSSLTIGISILLIHRFSSVYNYWGRILGQAFVYIIIGAVLFTAVVYKGRTIYTKEYWKFTLPIAIPTIFHLLANIVLSQSDKVMLQGLVGNSATGIYALSSTFGAVLSTIWNALNNSWVPFYYEYTRQNQIEKMREHAYNYTELFTVITMGFILLSREVYHIYAKQSFWEGTELIPYFSIGYYFVFLYSFPVNFEFYNKKTKTIAIGTTFAAVCNILLNYLFIKLWGIKGAVIATAISHGLQFGFHYICAKGINSADFPFRIKQFIPGVFAVCLSCILYWIVKDMWIIRWILAAILGVFMITKVLRRREIF